MIPKLYMTSSIEFENGDGTRVRLGNELVGYFALAPQQTRGDRAHVAWEGIQRVTKSQHDILDSPSSISARCIIPKTNHTTSRPIQNSRLLFLPGELKGIIIYNVRSQQDLSNLSKTCIDFREAALPFLFRNIKVIDDQGRHLLRTISENRDRRHIKDMIRTFELRATTFHSHSLVLDLIQAAPELTRLEIHYLLDQSRYTRRNSAYNRQGDVLSSALIRVKNTLRHLKISYKLLNVGPRHASSTTNGYCSLKKLHRLQTVDIPFFLLLGWDPKGSPAIADVLPRNLSTLKFGDDEWGNNNSLWDESLMMIEFAEHFHDRCWKITTPQLKNVILSLWSYDESKVDCPYREWRTYSGERNFKQLCAENGLQCRVIRNEWASKKWI